MNCLECGEGMIDKGSHGYTDLVSGEHFTDHQWFCQEHGTHIEKDCKCEKTCKQNRLHKETKHECEKCGSKIKCSEAHGDKKTRHNCKVKN